MAALTSIKYSHAPLAPSLLVTTDLLGVALHTTKSLQLAPPPGQINSSV